MAGKVIIIAGPTATGKTDLAIEIAQKFNAEVVNFDSLLFYKELNIGTAKPSVEEQKLVPHHLIDIASISKPLNAADYFEIAVPLINKLHSDLKTVILVGGSGFYLQAVLNGMYDSPTTPKAIIERSNQLYEAQGITPFLEELKVVDPKSFDDYHENDHYRIRRALEHFWSNQTPFSQMRSEMGEKKLQAPPIIYNWDVMFNYIDIDKTDHLPIIQKRTEKMIEQGLIDEVKNLLSLRHTGLEKPMQSIGYKEAQQFINGEFENINDCIERINISTRQLAKAQRTWFKKIPKNNYQILLERAKILTDIEHFLGK